jgi:metal-sulfur cluster biosynthetic enzyme
MVTKKEVLKKLDEVIDPELGINIVDLGLVYGIEIKKKNVKVKMTFTTPFCPLGEYLVDQVKEKIKTIKNVENVDVELVFDQPWSYERMSKKARDLFL